MTKLAVLMLVYKNDKLRFVKASLESIQNQTFQDFHLYIQKDGYVSEDVDHYLNNQFLSKKIFSLGSREESMGIAFSRNEVLKRAVKENYDYYALMDADDIAFKKRLESQIKFLENNTEVDVCGCHIEEFGDGISYNNIVRYPLKHKEMFELFKYRVPIANVTAMFRKSFFDKSGYYPLKGHINNEDTLMWLQGYENNCIFANVNMIGVKVRVSKSFFRRRTNFKKVISDFRNRIIVNRSLRYGFSSYILAVGMLLVNISPFRIKKILYKFLR